MFDLSGEVALCTGGTSGIGRRMAWALSQAGADVVLVGRRADELREAAAEINQSGRGCAAILAADLLDRSALPTIVPKASEHFGPPSILNNAAGMNPREPWDAISFESWDATININLTVPFFLAQACAPHMIKNKRGRIINIASLQSIRAFGNGISYGAAKGGVVQLTRAMAQSWSADGITVNAILPGFFPTDLTAAVYKDKDVLAHHVKMTAIGRTGELEDLDGLTVFLASKASDYITGQTIPIDGGYSAK